MADNNNQFTIYLIKDEPAQLHLKYENSYISADSPKPLPPPDKNDYIAAYTAALLETDTPQAIYNRFTKWEKPEGYHNRSLAGGDIIALTRQGNTQFCYVNKDYMTMLSRASFVDLLEFKEREPQPFYGVMRHYGYDGEVGEMLFYTDQATFNLAKRDAEDCGQPFVFSDLTAEQYQEAIVERDKLYGEDEREEVPVVPTQPPKPPVVDQPKNMEPTKAGSPERKPSLLQRLHDIKAGIGKPEPARPASQPIRPER